MKYTHNVLWLKPFVESSRTLVPLRKLKSIRGYRVTKGKQERSYGSMTNNNGRYSMALLLQRVPKKKSDPYIDATLSGVLECLAHELAHLSHWDHTIEHFTLQCQILLKFCFVLTQEKIHDTSKDYSYYLKEQK